MTKFFKNIRQQLAAQNKVVAYMRNAISEILFVVIGVLIDLILNTIPALWLQLLPVLEYTA